jgi:glucose-6-phosphate isomerase
MAEKAHLNWKEGLLEGYEKVVVRKLSDMQGFYSDERAYSAMLQEDPVIYRVFEVPSPAERGHLSYALTVIYPGRVGREFFMTKGHFHERRECAEVYIGVKGHGLLLMQDEGGEVRWTELGEGDIVYVPPRWAHRSVNVGDGEFAFLAVYPSDAGHDYGVIAGRGFRKIVLATEDGYEVVDNPRW